MKIRSLLILLLSMWIAPFILAQQTPQSLADAELPFFAWDLQRRSQSPGIIRT